MLIEDGMKILQDLGEHDALFDELFQKFKQLYFSMTEQEKEMLFMTIIQRIEVPKKEIEPYVEALTKCSPDDSRWSLLLSQVRNRFYSPRLKLFQKISHSSGGLKFLLDFRGDLLAIQRYSTFNLSPLDSDIVFLFEMWFQEGFLYLEEITLDSAYNQIELIKNSDMVHPMASIEEMGQRLGKDRRCFALYHRFLPREPIVFIEVALTKGLAKNVSEVMAQAGGGRGQAKIDTAIFYSINNTQNGLTGLGLGKMLIGKVVDSLKDETIRNFATLSPVPGFWKSYLRPLLEGKDKNFTLKQEEIISLFSKKTIAKILARTGEKSSDPKKFNAALISILSNDTWVKDEALKKSLHPPMVKIAYHYIASEKNPRGRPLNPVANFHLGNGAAVSAKNINFLANPSPRGLKESCGIMVNYIYTFHWLGQIRRSFRWFDKMEIKGLFR
jgi:malonyl-CoA decarboxylase